MTVSYSESAFRTLRPCPECLKKGERMGDGEKYCLLKDKTFYYCDHCGWKSGQPKANYKIHGNDKRSQAVDMFVKGYPIKVIKKTTGISDWSLYDEINKRNIPKRTSGRKRNVYAG